MNTSGEPFQDFEWPVSRAYHWQAWLDEHGAPVVVLDQDDLIGLDSPAGVDFAWEEYGKSSQHPGPVLGPKIGSGKAHYYRPMARDHAALFRTFGDLDFRDQNVILAFASTYGLLLSHDQHQEQVLHDFGHHYAYGESHLLWAYEICRMREALQLVRPKTSAAASRDRETWNAQRMEAADDMTPYDKLTWLFDVHLQHVQGRMLIEPDLPPRLSLAPRTLLAAMWLQFALAVAGNKKFRQCKFCKRLFEISTEQTGFRRHREFCANPSCKTQDYRRRKRTALDLAKKGVPLGTIAEQINTKTATVQRWLASSSPRGKGTK